MSEASIKRIHASFVDDVETACREGRGEALLHRFLQALAEDLAAAVFLKMDVEVGRAKLGDATHLWNWVNEFPTRIGAEYLEEIAATFRLFGGSSDQIETVQRLAAEAFMARLTGLLDASQSGGSA